MKKDSRVNARYVSFRTYLIVFVTVAFLCAATVTIYTAQSRMPVNLFAALAILGYALFLSAAVCAIFAFFRRKVLMRPVSRLREAARRVASGDFSVRIAPLRKDGKRDEFEILFEDFNTMAEELSSIETLKTDFISNVSHEMKTPLAVIQNYAELLQVDSLSEERRKEYASSVKEATVKMSALISNIMRLNRLENQKIVPDAEHYDVCRQIVESVLQFEDSLERKGLELDIDMEDAAFIAADRSLMEIVWNNLMSNAIKFTAQGGKITIREWTDGDKIRVSFTDNGCGVSAESIRHIFEKFYQGDTSHATEGNGLGLALVKQVLSISKGEIDVKSTLGEGTTFTVTMMRDDL